jgi:hypothetical protein
VDVLRRAEAPMTAREIADALIADKAPQDCVRHGKTGSP